MHLRFAQSKDEDRIHQLFQRREISRFLSDGKVPPRGALSDWIEQARGDVIDGGGLWVLCNEDRRDPIGVVRLAHDGGGVFELVYLLHSDLWGLGLATRMAYSVVARAFARAGASKVWAGADTPNIASIAVMKRLGMRFGRTVSYPRGEGVEYEILATDFSQTGVQPIPFTDEG